jgi:hypothetical protein
MRQLASLDERPRSAMPTTQLSDISRLSAIASELVAIRQHPTVGSDVGTKLDAIVAGLDATITALLHAAPVSEDGPTTHVGNSADPRGRVRASGERLSSDQSVFLAWLADPTMPDELAAGSEWSAEPLSHLLGRLSTSPRGLTADAAAVVGMPAGTSMGNAAVALLLAVEDPAGPRCRSYRAAASYLRGPVEPLDRQPRLARRFVRAPGRSPTTRTDA